MRRRGDRRNRGCSRQCRPRHVVGGRAVERVDDVKDREMKHRQISRGHRGGRRIEADGGQRRLVPVQHQIAGNGILQPGDGVCKLVGIARGVGCHRGEGIGPRCERHIHELEAAQRRRQGRPAGGLEH